MNAKDESGKTALHLAMENKYFSRVETLLEFGAGSPMHAWLVCLTPLVA